MTTTPEPEPTAAQLRVLDDAARELAGRTRHRAVEIAGDVLRAALSAPRSSLPIRANPPHDDVRVSDQVIITLLHRRVAELVPSAAVGRVALRVERDQSLSELTVELFVQYGEVLVDVADAVRSVTDGLLAELLGPSARTVAVRVLHVHVSDVTVGDPHLVHPDDER